MSQPSTEPDELYAVACVDFVSTEFVVPTSGVMMMT